MASVRIITAVIGSGVLHYGMSMPEYYHPPVRPARRRRMLRAAPERGEQRVVPG